ncbi:MAG TPA: hypothetical protein VFK13_04405 [Gemmatimonadaceae bacterium]|nr:hypothetical protein [Gemmatimonadaceae bacterium]
MRFSHVRPFLATITLAVAVVFSAVADAGAQAIAASPAPCASGMHQQFGFWVGRWVVRDTSGAEIGTSEVTTEASGCALVEHWRSGNGGTGVSVNYADSSGWRQLWVGSQGGILRLAGGLVGSSMVLTGDRVTPQGPVQDRIEWTPMADGHVRQRWTTSKDGGATWQVSFVGFYERAPNAGS